MKKAALCITGFVLASALFLGGCDEKVDSYSETGVQMLTENGKEMDSQAGASIHSLLSPFMGQMRAFAGYLFFTGQYDRMGQVDFDESQAANSRLSIEQLAAMKDYWTIACFGVNSVDMKLGKGNQCDSIMICNINKRTGEVKLASVFVDTYLNISEMDSYNKINAAYTLGGPTQAVAALNKNLGLNITDFVTFNWKAVADAINILGGIDVEISDDDFYYMNAFITETVRITGVGSSHLKQAGMNRLDGVQAVAYGRLRLTHTDDTRRQVIIIEKLFEKAKLTDWTALYNMMEVVLPQVAASIETAEILPLAQEINKFHIGEMTDFPRDKGEIKKIGKVNDTFIPQTLENNVADLHQFLFGEEHYTVPPYIIEISGYLEKASNMSQEEKAAGQ